jgi:type I restriction enzyme, S subunit
MVNLLHTKRVLEHAIATTSGVNHPRTSWNALGELQVPLPPLPEQRAIAHVLSTLRQAIEATERVIAADRELKRSMMKHLFTYGPVPVDQADQVVLKETKIGTVNEDWAMMKLEDVTHEIRLRNFDLNLNENNVLSVSNTIGFFPSDRLLGKDLSRYKIIKHRQFGYNPMRLNVGSIAFLENNRSGIVSPDYIVFETVEGKLLPEYFDQYRYTDKWWRQIRMSGQGSIRIRYYYRHIKEFFIPVPELGIQSKISKSLDAVDKKIQYETKRKNSLEELFKSLLHHLMTGKVRVNTLIPGPSPSKGEGSNSFPQRGEVR